MKPSHVLITRPEPQAAELALMLNSTGLQVMRWPVFRFVARDPGIDFNKVWARTGRRLAVFSSTRAVEFGLEQLPGGYLQGVEIAAIGPATARALESAGHPPSVLSDEGHDSESLLEHHAFHGHAGSALLLTAPGGRQKLYSALLERDWKVQFAHVYEREAAEPDPAMIREIENAPALISVWTSGNTLQHAASHLGARAWARICAGEFVVISGRIAELASAYSVTEPRVAAGPGNVEIARTIHSMLEEYV